MAFRFIEDFFKSIIKKENGSMSYKKRADINKEKIIKKEVKTFERLCIDTFEFGIENGKKSVMIGFFSHTTFDFMEEISEIVLRDLKLKYADDVEILFAYDGCNCSYKNIKMIAK